MKTALLVIALFACQTLPAFAGTTSDIAARDLELAAQQARQDLALAKLHFAHDRALKQSKGSLAPLADLEGLLNGQKDHASCLEACDAQCNGQGGGGASCWDACLHEGYGSSSCATRCGVSNSASSAACWDACHREGYGSSSCASRCGITTGGGSETCWNYCHAEGYGSTSCASRCGIDTPAGSAQCWKYCTAEGYGSSACATRCGTN